MRIRKYFCVFYHSDLWSFDLDALAWTQHTPALSPSPRSGCVFAPDHESGTAVLYGGFCSQPAAGRGDIEKSVTLADQWYARCFCLCFSVF